MKTTHTPQFYSTRALLILLSIFGSTLLWAETPSGRLDSNKLTQSDSPTFSIHDTDKSGSLSRDEYRRFVAQIENRRKSSGAPMARYSTLLKFKEIDNNTDGYITEDEMIEALNRQLQKRRRYRYRGGRIESPK